MVPRKTGKAAAEPPLAAAARKSRNAGRKGTSAAAGRLSTSSSAAAAGGTTKKAAPKKKRAAAAASTPRAAGPAPPPEQSESAAYEEQGGSAGDAAAAADDPFQLSADQFVIVGFDLIESRLDKPTARVNTGVYVAPLAKASGRDYAVVQLEANTVHGPFKVENVCIIGRVFSAPADGLSLKIGSGRTPTAKTHQLKANDYFAIPEGVSYTFVNTHKEEPSVLSIQMRAV